MKLANLVFITHRTGQKKRRWQLIENKLLLNRPSAPPRLIQTYYAHCHILFLNTQLYLPLPCPNCNSGALNPRSVTTEPGQAYDWISCDNLGLPLEHALIYRTCSVKQPGPAFGAKPFHHAHIENPEHEQKPHSTCPWVCARKHESTDQALSKPRN